MRESNFVMESMENVGAFVEHSLRLHGGSRSFPSSVSRHYNDVTASSDASLGMIYSRPSSTAEILLLR